MKKILGMGGLLAGGLLLIGGLLHAGTPLDQPYQGSGPYSDTSVIVSTYALSAGSISLTMPALSAKNSGGTSYTGRNCITGMLLQLSYGSTFYLLDGGTTDYYVFGAGLTTSTGTTGTINLREDHLGPLCGTAGNAWTLSVPAPSAATVNNAVTAEGFTTYVPSVNKGQ